MVALLLGLLLTVAVLVTQSKLTAQNSRTLDTAERDHEARAALGAIASDLSAAGFLFAGQHVDCAVQLSYRAGLSSTHPAPGYVAAWPVGGFAASAGTPLPFVAPPGITLNHPPKGSANRSDVLVIRRSADTSRFNDAVAPLRYTHAPGTWTPLTDGRLPVTDTASFAAGDVAMVRVPLTSGAPACLRVPVTTVASRSVGSTPDPRMPPDFYAGFSTQLAALGLGGMSNATLQAGWILDLGPTAGASQQVQVYYVDQPSGAGADPWPVLMRATVNALDDTELPGTRQEIAAGVVSFQVLFGVDLTGADAVTGYETGDSVALHNHGAKVRSVKLVLVTRTLRPDPDPAWASRNARSSVALGPGFTSYTLSPAEQSHHFEVHELEVAVRNAIWPK